MKPKLAFAWFVVSLALAAVLLVQWRNGRQQKLLLEKLQLQVERIDQQEKLAKARAEELEKEARKLRAELGAAELDLNQARLSYNAMLQMTNPPASAPSRGAAGGSEAPNSPAGMGAFFSSMMKDPEMRKAMEQQQRMGLDMIYGSLYKQLQLTDEQETAFKNALLALQMTNMAQAGAMFESGTTNRAAIAEKMAADRAAAEEAIKQVIGEEKFAKFQDYNQTLGERMMLEQFARQTDLPPEQSEQLLAIIREEKRNLQINLGNENLDPARNWQQVMESGEAAERLFAQQEMVNERVLERAHQLLTPEQIAKLRPVLTNQLALQRAGLKMARQMFQNQSGPGGPGPAPQPVR